MDIAVIIYILGYIIAFLGGFMFVPATAGLFMGEAMISLVYACCGLIYISGGILITFHKPKNMNLFSREGAAAVALGWIILSLLGAVPFVITGDIPSYVDAVFETISGFTTTGSSILTNVEGLTKTSLFWRSFTHWVGGMGVFVFIIMIAPMMGGQNMNLMKAESPGPDVGKFVPHVRDTAKILYRLYLAITVAEIICLLLAGMPLFDSITLTFGSVGTGGFGVKNDSCASYTALQQNIITVFMILSGINYVAYFYLITGKIKEIFKVEEIRWYLGIILTSAVVIAVNIRSLYGSWEETFRHSFFQVGTIITTTGYATTDFDLWPSLSKFILVLLMIVGACAGSTGGGMKVSRWIILTKSAIKELSLVVHPHAVKKIRMDNRAVPHNVLRSTNTYFVIYFMTLMASVLLISIDNFDFETNFTAVAATLNNIGPGLAKVGPTMNFFNFSAFSKVIMMFDMLAGRLELFPIMILFFPQAWRKH